SLRITNEGIAALDPARVSICPATAVGGELPFLSQLLRLRTRGDRTARHVQRRVARAAARRAVPSVSPRRFRPRTLSDRYHPDRSVHGYPTSDPVRHLLVLCAFSVGSVAARPSAAGAAGHNRPARAENRSRRAGTRP